MTNAEKYKDKLKHILAFDEPIAVVDGRPKACCSVVDCIGCRFFFSPTDCNKQAIEWLLEESEDQC